jgi:hypothetical protein
MTQPVSDSNNNSNSSISISKTNSTGDCTQQRQCPFEPQRGYTTDETRREYLKIKGLDNDCVGLTLSAETDQSMPLYYWQLYSLLGTRPIYDICATFYKGVFEDDTAEWFKEVFNTTAPKQHHINAQAAYWVDAFGGGRRYHGGNGRLTFHHMYNAKSIMTAEGKEDCKSENDHPFSG